MIFLAKLISFLTNPFVVVLPGPFLIVYRMTGDVSYSLKWELFSILFIAVSALFILFGVLRGFFSDIDVSRRNQRKIMFCFFGIVSLFYFFSVLFFNGPKILLITSLGLVLAIIIFDIVNISLKASIHVATFTSFIIMMFILYGSYFWIGFLLIPIVAWARIKIKRHTLAETIVGGVLGGLLTIIALLVIKYLVI